MTKKILAVFLAVLFLFLSVGCGNEVKPITNNEESTIIKDAKSADEFIKKNDLDSLAYAYIYNLKSGLDSYYSATTGTISAKVLFIDYLIDFTSDLIKKGNAFYCKEHSASALMNVDTEYYLNSNDKIVHSTDLKNYTVYSTEDFLKIDYSPAQYTIAGLVFTEESILKAELVSNENGVITVKYKLDNDKATHLVKRSMKNTGGLSDYPSFTTVDVTLTMKSDLTPVSYDVALVYDASKPILGTSTATHNFSCTLSKINENVEVPNEAFFVEKLGGQVSELVVDEEVSVKDELLSALSNMDFGKGVNVDGNF
ncbi:MAG: hypothetical protein J5832_07105, partial [Clostridia bacterium]|nr:hypothetical protein [Clostridia bacterium]